MWARSRNASVLDGVMKDVLKDAGLPSIPSETEANNKG